LDGVGDAKEELVGVLGGRGDWGGGGPEVALYVAVVLVLLKGTFTPLGVRLLSYFEVGVPLEPVPVSADKLFIGELTDLARSSEDPDIRLVGVLLVLEGLSELRVLLRGEVTDTLSVSRLAERDCCLIIAKCGLTSPEYFLQFMARTNTPKRGLQLKYLFP
jgi:hypothetical protein